MKKAMKKTIFVIDDSEAILTSARQVLEERYRIFTAMSAEKMFSLLEKFTPEIILLDIEMDGMKGDEALAELKGNPGWAIIPVVFLTGWSDDLVIAHCLELGALDVITKPFSPLLLSRRIENYLNPTEIFEKRTKYLLERQEFDIKLDMAKKLLAIGVRTVDVAEATGFAHEDVVALVKMQQKTTCE